MARYEPLSAVILAGRWVINASTAIDDMDGSMSALAMSRRLGESAKQWYDRACRAVTRAERAVDDGDDPRDHQMPGKTEQNSVTPDDERLRALQYWRRGERADERC